MSKKFGAIINLMSDQILPKLSDKHKNSFVDVPDSKLKMSRTWVTKKQAIKNGHK